LSRVSFRLRNLEGTIAWGLAVSTAWIAMVQLPDVTVAWLSAFMALSVGAWSRAFPASHPSAMLARAALLLVTALFLHLDPAAGGVTGAFFFWPIAIASTYALLLDRVWSLGIFVLAALEFAAAAWLLPGPVAWRPVLASLGVLVAWPVVALLFARTIHRTDGEVEASLTDPHTGLYNASGLITHGSELFRQARKEERPLSLALLRISDENGTTTAVGPASVRKGMARAVRALCAQAGGGAIAARFGSNEYAVLLPGMTSAQAKAMLQARLGQPPVIEVDVRNQKMQVPVEMAASALRDQMTSLHDLYARVRHKLRHRIADESRAHDD
jgi:GGDEF domain-containing protein